MEGNVFWKKILTGNCVLCHQNLVKGIDLRSALDWEEVSRSVLIYEGVVKDYVTGTPTTPNSLANLVNLWMSPFILTGLQIEGDSHRIYLYLFKALAGKTTPDK